MYAKNKFDTWKRASTATIKILVMNAFEINQPLQPV